MDIKGAGSRRLCCPQLLSCRSRLHNLAPRPPPFQALEARWSALNGSIDELRAERGEVAAAVVEAEREVLVWERRVQLEKEMQVGGGF